MANGAATLSGRARLNSRSIVGWAARLGLIAAACALAGCFASGGALPNPFASPPTPQQQAADIDPMLQAAGFTALPAATPQQTTELKSLPPLQMSSYMDGNGATHYWMADPDSCNCLFHGNEAAYQRYENIKLENQVAERDRQAMEAQQMQQQQMMMGPGMFGPPGFGYGSGFGFGGGFGGLGFGGPGIGIAF